jgi:uncharacterized protein
MLDRNNYATDGVHAPARAMSLEELDAWLSSEDAPPECMLLSDLDGFLTGIVVGPDFIAPSEWMPAIWGGEAPQFADAVQTQAVLGAIMDRYNEIVRQVDDDSFQPILWRFAETGTVIASDWAYGFAQAIALRPRRWTKMAKSEAGLLLVPIMMLCETDELLDELGFSGEELSQTVEEAIDVLPVTVGKHHIEEDQLGPRRSECFQALLGRGGYPSVEPLVRQGDGERLCDGALVFDQQDARLRHCPLGGS